MVFLKISQTSQENMQVAGAGDCFLKRYLIGKKKVEEK